jgi:secreted trypsin-like serine protease
LIDADSVLTAAHCVIPENASQSLLQVKVFVGRTVLISNQGQVRFSTKAAVHPNYPAFGTAVSPYDVAVLQLNRKVSNIKPIELATSEQNNLERPGRHATVAGWGNTVNDPDNPVPADRMQEAQIPIVSDSLAEEAHGPDFFPPLMIGAGGKQTITCQGDSGGPLFVQTSGNGDGDNGDSDGKYTQIGITSYGPPGCLAASRIAVYTEVNAKPIASFIESAADLDDDDDDNDDGDGDK